MTESEAIKKLRQHFEYLKHAWKPHYDYETMDAIGYAIQALEKQEKIKEVFTHYDFYGCEFNVNDYISALSEIKAMLKE